MPNIITHGLFAQSTKPKIKNEKIKQCIMDYPHEFMIGSNGPDFLFFYRFFHEEGKTVRQYGSLLHSSHINDFYRIALAEIEKQSNQELKDAMIAYVAGHLCHWALDSRSHPYIFYKTGNFEGFHAYMHHRFESMLDAMLLKRMLNTDVKHYNYDLLASRSSLSIAAIAEIYVPVLQQLFQADVDEKTIALALKDWQRLNALLHDPMQWKSKVVSMYEKMVNKPWLYQGNIVPVEIDESFDILNLKHEAWCYPVDKNRVSHESFIEIFNRSVSLACTCIENMLDSEALCNILRDESYDTGVSGNQEMLYFDLIYGDDNENL